MRIFLGEISWEEFFVRNFFGRNFFGGIFGRNSSSTFLKSAKLFEYERD